MAKVTKTRVLGVRATTVAAFEGTLFSVIGLIAAIFLGLSSMVDYTTATDSLIKGMAFGIAEGILAIIILPIIYGLAGWLIGLIHGFIFNAVLKASGGIVLDTSNK